MARMVFGRWTLGSKPRPIVHFHAEGRNVCFGKALCGTDVGPRSTSETTGRVDLVDCKRCKAKLKAKGGTP